MPINRTRGPLRKKLPNGRGQHNRRQFPTLRSLIVAMPDGRVVDLVDPSRSMAYGTNIGAETYSKGRYTQNQADGVSEIQAEGACQYQTFSRIAIIRRNYDPAATGTISDSATSTSAGGAQWGISGSELLLNVANTVQVGASSGAGITTGVEHVVGVTYDGTTVRFFIDGRAVGSNVNAQTFTIESTATLFSRGGSASPNEDLNGAMKLHSAFEGALSIDEMLAITANPALLFAAAYRDSWFAGGGGAADLAGAATDTATAAGSLTTQIPIIGAAATVATATGALSTSIPLLGAAAVTATASGDLSAQIKFNGSAIAQALAAGGITTGIPLVGAASGTASASGSLDASASLAAAAQAIATAVGSLTTQITLSGAAISQAFASGELTAPGSGLSGTASGQVSAAGSLTTGIPLVGAAQAYATGAGGLTTIIPLAGAAASVSAATGNLTVQITLTGAAIAQALAGGVLTTQVVLSGSAVSLASAAGVLTGGSAIIDSTWLVRPKARRYSVIPEQRIYKGSR